MRIAVMGAGAVGCYFGGEMARKGHEVHLIARGAHLEAIRSGGLHVRSKHYGDFTVKPASATDRPEEVGPVDLVLFTVKSYDIETAARQAAPLMGPETCLLTILNGVEHPEQIGAILGRDRVLDGLCFISVAVTAPGEVTLHSTFRRLVFGEISGERTPRARRVLAAMEGCNFDVALSTNIRQAIWEKFAFIASFSGICAAGRANAGMIRQVPEALALYRQLIEEVCAVGRAEGADLGSSFVEECYNRVLQVEPHVRASLMDDLEKGKRLEVETLQGAVVRGGRKHGLPTPATDTVYALIKMHQKVT
jgi:2-dehydropantoate 2-reductase